MKIKRRRGEGGGRGGVKSQSFVSRPVARYKGEWKKCRGGGGGGVVEKERDRQCGGWERGGRSANYRSYTLIAMFSLALTNTLHTRAYVVWLRPPG